MNNVLAMLMGALMGLFVTSIYTIVKKEGSRTLVYRSDIKPECLMEKNDD
jgi:hypothetical protein